MRDLLTVPVLLSCVCLSFPGYAGDGNRLSYLDENNPYSPGLDFPKLITPQWVGEDGVEAVVIFAIDDMRDPPKYEAYLRPILQRLKQIDGRAPVSIMTCNVKPDDPQLQSWLEEGLSIEIHTVDHPCPLLAGGDFAKAKSTYDRCVDLMNRIPGNKPVAFRMPCCDSLNTVSPRFFAEIFNRTTEDGHFLQIDTSVFNFFTSDDPDIPRELIVDEDGRDRFLKYMPKDRGFVNYIENYPYPYVINNQCWEFPCLAPSDWSAQHLHGVNNPVTLADWKAAIDITVIKQGVLNLVFHPHGWIRNDQVVDLIDHAVSKHGKKVKFLTFREAAGRLNRSMLGGTPLRNTTGTDQGVRILDTNGDGRVDVCRPGEQGTAVVRTWDQATGEWRQAESSASLAGAAFCFMPPLDSNGKQFATAFAADPSTATIGRFQFYQAGENSVRIGTMLNIFKSGAILSERGLEPQPRNIKLIQCRDIDNDGYGELILASESRHAVLKYVTGNRESPDNNTWVPLPFGLPGPSGRNFGADEVARIRFVDINEDGFDDVVLSDSDVFGAWLFESMETGWAIELRSGKRVDGDQAEEIPPIVREDGSDNGFFVHGRSMYWQNEDTAELEHLVDVRTFGWLLGDRQPEAKSAQASLECIEVREGFDVQLVAAEPMLRDPVAFDWGPDGRLWVAEMGGYPNGADEGAGRIRALEDTVGDGRYDKSTVFLDNVNFPNGVMPWRNGVLVSAAPEIFFAEDTDGDGTADKREILFSGFVEGNQQHRVNGFAYGLDNWVYIANGDSGGTITSVKTGESIDIRGRDLRIRPDTGEMEAVTGQTQFGRNRDDWGNWFGCNNSRPMWHYVLDDHYLRRNPNFAPPDPRREVPEIPGNSPVFPISRTLERFNDFHTANRFTSACSTIVYRDDALGPQFVGNSFTCEPVHNLVSRAVMEPDGVTFRSRRAVDEQDREFLRSSDNWFRPVFCRTGPDGALWIADMYRHVIEHPKWIPEDWQKRLDLRAGHDRGRIYRVAPVPPRDRLTAGRRRARTGGGFSLSQQPSPFNMEGEIPRLARMSGPQLVTALQSSNGWIRDTAQRLLVERQDSLSIPALQEMSHVHEQAVTRLQALCTLDGIDGLTPELIVTALGDSHPDVRRHAIRLSERYTDKSDAIRDELIKLIDHPSPSVRLQLAYTLGGWRHSTAERALGHFAAKNADNPWLMAAAMSAPGSNTGFYILRAIVQDADSVDDRIELVRSLVRQVVRSKDRLDTLHVLEWLTDNRTETVPAWRLETLVLVMDELRRRNMPLKRALWLDPPLDPVPTPEVEAGLEVMSQLTRFQEQQRPIVSDISVPVEQRVSALRFISRMARENKTTPRTKIQISSLIVPQQPNRIQTAAIDELIRLNRDEAARQLIADWSTLSPTVRSHLVDTLLSRDDTIAHVTDSLRAGMLMPHDISTVQRQRLLQHRRREIREAAEQLFEASRNSNRQAVIDRFAGELPEESDALVGRAVFEKRCSSCHKLGGIGNAFGPDLASLKDRSQPALLAAILDPNRAVEAKYLSYTAVTDDGRSVSGLVHAESGNSITLVATDGKQHTLLRNELDEFVSSGKSFMPEGLEKDLTPVDVANVMAFLQSNIKPKPFAGNEPAVVRAGDDGVIRLPATRCEIYGPTLVFEPQYRNLGFWGSPSDVAVWQIDVRHTGTYAVRLKYACPPDTAGNAFRISARRSEVAAKVNGTESWGDYREMAVGRLELSSGRQQLSIQATDGLNGYLMDLVEVALVPTE